jgi:hypothetical protein
LPDPLAFEIVGVEQGGGKQKGEALGKVHRDPFSSCGTPVKRRGMMIM